MARSSDPDVLETRDSYKLALKIDQWFEQPHRPGQIVSFVYQVSEELLDHPTYASMIATRLLARLNTYSRSENEAKAKVANRLTVALVTVTAEAGRRSGVIEALAGVQVTCNELAQEIEWAPKRTPTRRLGRVQDVDPGDVLRDVRVGLRPFGPREAAQVVISSEFLAALALADEGQTSLHHRELFLLLAERATAPADVRAKIREQWNEFIESLWRACDGERVVSKDGLQSVLHDSSRQIRVAQGLSAAGSVIRQGVSRPSSGDSAAAEIRALMAGGTGARRRAATVRRQFRAQTRDQSVEPPLATTEPSDLSVAADLVLTESSTEHRVATPGHEKGANRAEPTAHAQIPLPAMNPLNASAVLQNPLFEGMSTRAVTCEMTSADLALLRRLMVRAVTPGSFQYNPGAQAKVDTFEQLHQAVVRLPAEPADVTPGQSSAVGAAIDGIHSAARRSFAGTNPRIRTEMSL